MKVLLSWTEESDWTETDWRGIGRTEIGTSAGAGGGIYVAWRGLTKGGWIVVGELAFSAMTGVTTCG